ncbi:hypothetical protein QUF94_19865 [Peribacillus sp. NJ4]|uniref:hypothetical protein n=1 Tax=Peribacillus sp. NJ4 TaxID=3055862 RepID=UPI0025A0C20A|nr:hypothetical protein [Peribacillus sp. NJ4]MDM5213660.1 hypothetical protein [Peribacillus sp. NJ4]
MRWKDIDFEQKIIYIRQIYDINAKQFKVGAKTSAGVRSILLRFPNDLKPKG